MKEDNVQLPLQPLNIAKPLKRRDLLPLWIKAFIWLFIIFWIVVPVAIIFALLGYDFKMSLLGLETNRPFSATGIAIIILFIFKGFVAYALWQGKTGAIKLAKADVILSTVICIFAILYSLFGPVHSFSLRLELIVIFFYHKKISAIQYDWENFNNTISDVHSIAEPYESLE